MLPRILEEAWSSLRRGVRFLSYAGFAGINKPAAKRAIPISTDNGFFMEFLLSDLRREFDPINSSMSSTIGGLGCHDAADG